MQKDFLQRIETEYQNYMAGLTELPKQEIIDRASEITAMSEIYRYLRYGSVPVEQVEYLTQVAYPLEEILGIYFAFPRNNDGHIELTLFDICDKDLFSDPDVEKHISETRIQFHRKPSSLEELMTCDSSRPTDQFVVEKIVELTPQQYIFFTTHLICDFPFISYNKEYMRSDGSVYHCLLVRDTNSSEGILVESEGYDYARYCAAVPDCGMLDLKDIPIERYANRANNQEHRPIGQNER